MTQHQLPEPARPGRRRHAALRRICAGAALAALLCGTAAAPATAGEVALDPSAQPALTAVGPSTATVTLDTDVDRLLAPTGMLFGASVARRDHATTAARLDELEQALDRRLDAHRWYARWDGTWPPTQVVESVEEGRVPVLSVEARLASGALVPWSAIARGEHDARIAEHARAVRSLGVPISMTFQHEPEFASANGTPADYRAAWRRYVEVFRAEGATNVLWTWVVTPTVFLASPPTARADDLYPGDDVVDWVGLDAYNWFGCMANGQDTWRPMAQIAQSFRAFGARHGKPLMLAEWGSVEDPTDPGRKAAWIRQSMSTLMSWPEMKAVLWFDHHGNCPWWVDSSPQSFAAFAQVAEWRSAHGRTQAWLRTTQEIGPAPFTVRLDGSRSTAAGRATGWGITSWRVDLGDGTVRTGTGRPPSDLTHTYGAGTHTARLTVTDGAGRTATDTVRVVAADRPHVSAAGRDLAPTTATLTVWAQGHGLPGTVEVEWGATTAYGRSAKLELRAAPYVTTNRVPVDGLAPGTRYPFRVTVTTAAGEATATGTFTTPR